MLTVRINNNLVDASGISWSSVDPGGFEACSFTIPSAQFPLVGSTIRIHQGLQLLWEGRVEEPGEDFTPTQTHSTVTGVGFGARLKDDTMSMIFIDRDLTRWQGMSSQRMANLGTAYDPKTSPETLTDATTASPGLRLQIGPSMPGASGGICEAWYDSGFGNTIRQIQLTSTDLGNLTAGGANWNFISYVSDEDTALTTTVLMADQNNSSVAFRRDNGAAARRFALIQHHYTLTSAASNNEFWRIVKNLAVIGDHGVTLRQNGAGTDGFYPSDIADYARTQASNIDMGVLETASSFTALQVAYPDRVTFEQIIDDMSKLMGWHWGVWEPLNVVGSNPRLDFRSRPVTPTAVVSRLDCSHINLSNSLSSMYNRARVEYTDPFGTPSFVIVNLPNPNLTFIRTIDLNVGVGTSTLATTFGTQILSLSQSDNKAQGSVALPPSVTDAAGRLKPAHFLRAGLDRLKVNGMPVDNWITGQAATFRIKRVTSEVQGDNVLTTVEVDNGADLVETSQARLIQSAFGSPVNHV